MTDTSSTPLPPLKVQIQRCLAAVVGTESNENKRGTFIETERLVGGLETLSLLLGNIISAPSEEKFRRLKTRNARVASMLECLKPAAEQVLDMLGFRIKVVQFEEMWVLASPTSTSLENLLSTKSIVDSYLKSLEDFVAKLSTRQSKQQQGKDEVKGLFMNFSHFLPFSKDEILKQELIYKIELDRIERMAAVELEKEKRASKVRGTILGGAVKVSNLIASNSNKHNSRSNSSSSQLSSPPASGANNKRKGSN